MDSEETQESSGIILIPHGNSPERVETSIAAFNQPLANLLEHIGLPTENILSPIEERRKVIYALESTIEILPIAERQKSSYLSKFTVAVSVGLFDGAINFLWDEAIKALRRLADRFDLHYFLGVAGTINSRYKNLSSLEDLEAISDHDLLEICRRIGLINDINYKRLEYVNYLRNHASAAHPNDNPVSGIELLSLLESCLKCAILAAPDHSFIQIKKLLDNIRTKIIPSEDFALIGGELSKHSQERLDDFVLTIFGLYSDTKVENSVRVNIDGISPFIWECVSEQVKFQIGSKFGLFRKNGEVDRKNLVQQFLERNDAERYKDEDSLTAELLDKLQTLKTVHYEYNNFYTEYAHAKSIESSIPATGIPENVRRFFVKVICICWIGNGKGYKQGVDENAAVYYKGFIEAFTISEIKEFITLFNDSEFIKDLLYDKPNTRVRQLATFFKGLTKDLHINNVLDLIINFPGTLDRISGDSRYKEAMKYVK